MNTLYYLNIFKTYIENVYLTQFVFSVHADETSIANILYFSVIINKHVSVNRFVCFIFVENSTNVDVNIGLESNLIIKNKLHR